MKENLIRRRETAVRRKRKQDYVKPAFFVRNCQSSSSEVSYASVFIGCQLQTYSAFQYCSRKRLWHELAFVSLTTATARLQAHCNAFMFQIKVCLLCEETVPLPQVQTQNRQSIYADQGDKQAFKSSLPVGEISDSQVDEVRKLLSFWKLRCVAWWKLSDFSDVNTASIISVQHSRDSHLPNQHSRLSLKEWK
jgi:hypothetical protein